MDLPKAITETRYSVQEALPKTLFLHNEAQVSRGDVKHRRHAALSHLYFHILDAILLLHGSHVQGGTGEVNREGGYNQD